MSSNSSDTPDGVPSRTVRRTATDSSRGFDLEAIVVRYEGRADQCTIVPRECSDEAKLTTWLTADVDAFVDLEDAR